MKDFKKMKRANLEHYLFIANQIYDNQNDEQKAEIDAANAEYERRQAKKGAKATPAEQKVLDAIRADHATGIVTDTAHRKFNSGTLRRLVEKGLLRVENHDRLRTDDMEMVYWSTYHVNEPLDNALRE